MKKMILLLVMVLTVFMKSYSSEYLMMNHVMYWGWQEPGYIDSASLLIEPNGLYAECTMIIVFSSGGVSTDVYDSLEIDMNFNLPSESEIRHLDLWINGEPVKGVMYDKWTASLIYESIVERRIDPAILTKVGANEYNIKIFPLLNNLPRKIKIQYLTPINNLLTGNPMLKAPFNILKLSQELPEQFKLAFIGGTMHSSPNILENEDVSFSSEDDADFGPCEVAKLTNLEQYSTVNINFSEIIDSSMVMRTFNDETTGNNYFELAFKHSTLFDIEKNRKAIFLIDYIDENCIKYNKQDILNGLEYAIRNTFSSRDSFAILFSGMVTSFPGTGWVGADSTSITNFFDNLDPDLMNSYSNLPTLLVDGINFLTDRGGEGSLVLIASSNSNGSGTQANALISDYLESLEDTEIPIHIVDLDDSYYDSDEMHFIGGQYFRGNEYLYIRLSQLTVGEYYSIRQYAYNAMLENVNHRLSGYFKSLEVFVQSEGGYAFSNYKLQGSESLTYNDEAYRMVGKYVGVAPFYISVFGQDSENQVYLVEDTIQSAEILPGDTIVQKVWASQMIKDLYRLEQSTQVVNQIINSSIDEYILTSYSALLVLEPGFVIPEEFEDNEFPILTIVDSEEIIQENMLDIFPNPCNEYTTISYSIVSQGNVNLKIYNSMGQLVNTLVEEVIAVGEHTMSYDTSDLENGIYFCFMTIDGIVRARVRFVVA
jgi:hypothetical protein